MRTQVWTYMLAGLLVWSPSALAKDLTDFTNKRPTAEEIRRALTPEVQPQIKFRGIQVNKAPVSSEPKAVALSITFNFDSDALTDDAREILQQLGLALVTFESMKFRIEGHTDAVGSGDYNLNLSLRRAISVRSYLSEEFALSSEQLPVDGKGETELLNPDDPESGVNRRVEVVNLGTLGAAKTPNADKAAVSLAPQAVQPPTVSISEDTASAPQQELGPPVRPSTEDKTLSSLAPPAARPATSSESQSAASVTGQESDLKLLGSGTGFFVSAQGHALTNHHVVQGCKRIRIPIYGNELEAIHRTSDLENDLALLETQQPISNFAKFRQSTPIRRADKVVVVGYPLRGTGLVSEQISVTDGIVSALTGPGNRLSLLQITAPLQPGNSGGPLLDKSGNVVGVVVGKANADKVAEVTGLLPENVNFAIKSLIARNLLDALSVQYETQSSETEIALPDISARAESFTVPIECWG